MLLSAILALGGTTAAKTADPPVVAPPSPARIAELTDQATWRKLLHQSRTAFGKPWSTSDVTSQNFFLSNNGRADAAAELVATISAMQLPVGLSPDEHAQCRFPARYIWLKSVNGIDAAAPRVDCPAFKAWLGDEPIGGASLIFASGHLGNPSTFYGHMLLRLNTARPDREDRDQLLGKALNHGAVFPDDENGVAYIFNGLTGGYKATFSDLSFFNHEHRWNQDQLRDVWEYELNLDAEQVQLLAAHSWEMQRTEVPYYFLKQNCAFRIAEMVSVVLDESLLPNDKPWVMPVDVLDVTRATTNNGAPLVKAVRRLPSTQTKFREAYTALPDEARAVVRIFVGDREKDVEPLIAALPVDDQSAVIESLIDYYGISGTADSAPDEVKDTRNGLLVARMKRPPGSHYVAEDQPPPPDAGNKSSLVQVSGVTNTERGELVQLRLRGAFNDFLSRAPGSLPYSELTLGDIRVDVGNGDVNLRSAEIVRITTLSLSQTGLHDDSGTAWRMRFGVEQDRLDCDDCLVGYLEGGIGKASYLSGGLVGYGFLTGRIVGPDRDDGVANVGLSAGLITDPMKFARANIEVGAWQDLDGDGRTRSYAQVEARFGKSSDWDLNLSARAENNSRGNVAEFKIGLSRYW